MASCDQEIVNQLCKINRTLLEIRDKAVYQESRSGEYNSWKYTKVGKSWFLERLVTFAGSTLTINLDLLDLIKAIQKIGELPKAFQINRIEQAFNDSTARTFSIRAYNNPSSANYIELRAITGDTSTGRLIDINYKYPADFRLQFYYSSFTADKTVKIQVQVDEL